MAVRLARETLDQLGAFIALPRYDLAALRPGIVHLGPGGFHRAHMARYTHDVLTKRPADLSWGIVAAGLMPADETLAHDLQAQDGLYTLVERDETGEAVTVIGSLVAAIYAGVDSGRLLGIMERPTTKIVSLTVTENGYGLNRATKELDAGNGVIAADLADPRHPRSAIGLIVEACRRRKGEGAGAFTALSCDNIQHNGDVLRRAVLAFAEHSDRGLRDWIERHVTFPNTMVDRITPLTRADDVAGLTSRHGVVDARPVFCETFRQWVIEDRFVAGRPAWETVGAEFVADVAPYEFMKLRLLNTSHLAVAGLGRLMGLRFVDEAMRAEGMGAFMAALMDRETGPTVPPIAGIDIAAYKRTLVARFANPTIQDTTERVNNDAPLNLLLDPIRDRLSRRAGIDLLALALAAWIRRMRGVDETGQAIEPRHPMAARLRAAAEAGGEDPRPVLGLADLFGAVGRDERLALAVAPWLAALYRVGARATLAMARCDLAF